MKPYLIALSVGLLVGVIYGALNVRSPAPPVIALIGLLGILIGEQIPPVVKRWMTGSPVSMSSLHHDSHDHLFGKLPGRQRVKPPVDPAA
jgi:XapX domain-containing protein